MKNIYKILIGLAIVFVPYNAFAAISFDTSSRPAACSGTLTCTKSYTAAAGNPLLVVFFEGSSVSDNLTSITANGVTMTKMGNSTPLEGRFFYAYYVLGVSGTFNVVSTETANADEFHQMWIASYTGVSQTGQPDASPSSQPNNINSSSVNNSVTVNTTGSWLVGGVGTQGFALNTLTNGTCRNSDTSNCLFDSNGTVSTGSNTVTASYGGSTNMSMFLLSFKPVVTISGSAPKQDLISFSE